MPRFEPKRNVDKKLSDNYSYSEENIDSKNKITEAINETKKSINAITRIFWNPNTKKNHISEDLIKRLEPIWDSEITPLLIREFGGNTILSVIFYQGENNSIVMEIWDPCQVDSKPSQVFSIIGVPKSAVQNIAPVREKASVLTIENWI